MNSVLLFSAEIIEPLQGDATFWGFKCTFTQTQSTLTPFGAEIKKEEAMTYRVYKNHLPYYFYMSALELLDCNVCFCFLICIWIKHNKPAIIRTHQFALITGGRSALNRRSPVSVLSLDLVDGDVQCPVGPLAQRQGFIDTKLCCRHGLTLGERRQVKSKLLPVRTRLQEVALLLHCKTKVLDW